MGRKRHTPEHIKFLACGTGPGGALRAGRESHPMLAFRLHPRRGIKLITPLKLPYCGQPSQRKYLSCAHCCTKCRISPLACDRRDAGRMP